MTHRNASETIAAYLATDPVARKPWDNCDNPEPMDGIHYSYCRNCHGMLIVKQVEGSESRLAWVHPPKGWHP